MNSNQREWPVLKSYAGAHLRRIALPLGGIGTGTLGLGGRGDLRGFEVVNRPANGFAPPNCFFALRTQTGQGEVFCRALEGPIPPEDFEGSFGCRTPNHGLPRWSEAVFETAYRGARRGDSLVWPRRLTGRAFRSGASRTWRLFRRRLVWAWGASPTSSMASCGGATTRRLFLCPQAQSKACTWRLQGLGRRRISFTQRGVVAVGVLPQSLRRLKTQRRGVIRELSMFSRSEQSLLGRIDVGLSLFFHH